MADKDAITSPTAIKQFFGDIKEVTNSELMELVKADKAAYIWLGEESAKQLGVPLIKSVGKA